MRRTLPLPLFRSLSALVRCPVSTVMILAGRRGSQARTQGAVHIRAVWARLPGALAKCGALSGEGRRTQHGAARRLPGRAVFGGQCTSLPRQVRERLLGSERAEHAGSDASAARLGRGPRRSANAVQRRGTATCARLRCSSLPAGKERSASRRRKAPARVRGALSRPLARPPPAKREMPFRAHGARTLGFRTIDRFPINRLARGRQ